MARLTLFVRSFVWHPLTDASHLAFDRLPYIVQFSKNTLLSAHHRQLLYVTMPTGAVSTYHFLVFIVILCAQFQNVHLRCDRAILYLAF